MPPPPILVAHLGRRAREVEPDESNGADKPFGELVLLLALHHECEVNDKLGDARAHCIDDSLGHRREARALEVADVDVDLRSGETRRKEGRRGRRVGGGGVGSAHLIPAQS